MADAKTIPAEITAKINALLDESTSEWNMQEKNIMYKVLREKFREGVDEPIAEMEEDK